MVVGRRDRHAAEQLRAALWRQHARCVLDEVKKLERLVGGGGGKVAAAAAPVAALGVCIELLEHHVVA